MDHDQLKRIYQTVSGRQHARAHTNGIRNAAVAAFKALDAFYREPTWERLAEFASAEEHWSSFTRRPSNAYADDLRKAIKAGVRSFPIPGSINGNWSTSYKPAYGFVYAFWSTQRPGAIKIGVTSRHPTDRQAEFAKRHALQHLDILFFYELATPKDLEHSFHKRHGKRIKTQQAGDSREWFEFTPLEAHQAVNTLIVDLALKRLKVYYENRRVLNMRPLDIWPNGQLHLGGRRARLDGELE